MGKRLRSRILGHLKNCCYKRLAQITGELMHTLILNVSMAMTVNEMKNLTFLALELFYGKYPAENIHVVNSTAYQTF